MNLSAIKSEEIEALYDSDGEVFGDVEFEFSVQNNSAYVLCTAREGQPEDAGFRYIVPFQKISGITLKPIAPKAKAP